MEEGDALKRELWMILMEVLYHGAARDLGEGYRRERFLIGINNAIDLLNRLNEEELKKPSSDSASSSTTKAMEKGLAIVNSLKESGLPSCSPNVPSEFVCFLSSSIMVEPVIIASGQTFEKRFIEEYLKHALSCPVTKMVLPHTLMMPNHSLSSLITKWLEDNGSSLPNPADKVALAQVLGGELVFKSRAEYDKQPKEDASGEIEPPHVAEPVAEHPAVHVEDVEMAPQDHHEVPPQDHHEVPPQQNQRALDMEAFYSMMARNKSIMARQVIPDEDEDLHIDALASNILERFINDPERIP